MPFTWNSDAEKTLLLMSMGKHVSFDKTSSFCKEVAAALGGGVTPNAVRYIHVVFLEQFISLCFEKPANLTFPFISLFALK